jgi:succinate dehydrogenase/fumarate reductase flavoprotein subunit
MSAGHRRANRGGALAREESRGGHYRSDFPETLAPHRTFIRRGSDDAPMIQHSAIAEGV